ncbi:MAG: CGNR zinc finger domain-containing protein [Candidatus Lustribacter sp.]
MDFGYFCKGAYLAVDLVRTKGWYSGTERLTPERARAVLQRYGQERRITKNDLPRLFALRDRLRAVFTAGDDASARRHIAGLLADFPARLDLPAGGEQSMTFVPAAGDAVSWIGANAAIGLAFFVSEYGAARLGVCNASDCDDAFLDESKNRTKHYCSVGCARNENVRTFRARKKLGQQ